MPMQPIRYLLCQLELEGIRIAADHLISRLNSDLAEFPLVLLAETCDGQRLFCLDDRLPPYLRTALLESKPEFSRLEAAVRILEASGIIARATEYRTYTFPEQLAHESTEDVQYLDSDDPRLKAFGMAGLPGGAHALLQ